MRRVSKLKTAFELCRVGPARAANRRADVSSHQRLYVAGERGQGAATSSA